MTASASASCRPIPQPIVRQLTARRLAENAAPSRKKATTPTAACPRPGLFLLPCRQRGVVQVADHHLLPGLVAPGDGLRRVRVVLVPGRVVVVGGTLDPRPGR